MDTGWIVAIVLGSALVIFIVLFMVWFFYFRKRGVPLLIDNTDSPISSEGRGYTYGSLAHITKKTDLDKKWDQLLKELEQGKRDQIIGEDGSVPPMVRKDE